MLQFSNIQLQSNSKRFTKQNRKLIRISAKNSISSSKQPNQYVNEATIKWTTPLRIPIVYGQDIDFQIYDKHEFGYNPEEMLTLLYGTMRLSENQKIGKFAVYSSSEDHQKVGNLIMDIKKNKSETIRQGSSSISSILVRKTKQLIGKGYIIIKIEGKKVIRTESTQPISGEYLFLDQHQIGNPQPDDVLIIQLYSSKDDSLKARGKIPISSCTHSNRIQILDEQSKKFGQVYFQIENKNSSPNQNLSRVSQYHNNSQATLHRFRSSSESRLTNFGSTNMLGTSRPKKVSVVHNNNDIFFPKEKRFQIYQDKQTNIISYSKLSTMKFFDNHSKKYYKGAGIGKAQKTDFTAQYRYNPGVGDYKLPSIFDRY